MSFTAYKEENTWERHGDKRKYLDIHSRDKCDKNDIFDVMAPCSIFDIYISSENLFLCLVIKISICAKSYDL